MKLRKLTEILDKNFHKEYSLSWDNTGLLIGNYNSEMGKLLISLDVTGEVINEAISLNIDLIFSHHPLIFSPLKNIVSDNFSGQIILKLAANNIAVYCAHTNYDIMKGGLNDYIADILELEKVVSIIPNYTKWFKFAIYTPTDYEEKVRNTICLSGGGQWKDYSCCTFKTKGTGTFKPGENSKPFIGKKGSLSFADESRIECIISSEKLKNLIKNVLEVHPYEEPAYDIFPLENKFEEGGTGRIGDLKKSLYLNDFLSFIKEKLNVQNFKYILKDLIFADKKIRKIAVINGSINSIIENIADSDFDVLLCGEISYHNTLLLLEKDKMIIELGHAESELFAVNHIFKILTDINDDMNLGLKILKSNNKEPSWRYLIG